MKEPIKQIYLNSFNVKNLVNTLDTEEHISCLGLIGSAKSYIVAASSDITNGINFVICSDKERAAYFYNDIENILGEKDIDYSKKRVLFYPTSYKKPYEPEKGFGEALIIEYGFKNSRLLNEAKDIVKVTGRLIIKNTIQLLNHSKSGTVYCNLVKATSRKNTGYSIFFRAPKSFYTDYFLKNITLIKN